MCPKCRFAPICTHSPGVLQPARASGGPKVCPKCRFAPICTHSAGASQPAGAPRGLKVCPNCRFASICTHFSGVLQLAGAPRGPKMCTNCNFPSTCTHSPSLLPARQAAWPQAFPNSPGRLRLPPASSPLSGASRPAQRWDLSFLAYLLVSGLLFSLPATCAGPHKVIR